MLSRRLVALTLALGLLAAGTPAAAAGIPPPAPALEGDEVLVSADRLERRGDEGIVLGEGAVTLRHREVRLIADRVLYHERTKDVVADGNVVLDHGTDRIQGEHLELNLETRVGFMERAQGFIQSYYFTGRKIEKRGPDHYYLAGGSFTTCEGTMPDWSFGTTSADVTVDEYMHVWNPTLRIKAVPVFYFPYAVFPVKRDRATGLLIPKFGLRRTDGFTFGNAFYWAPRDNFDATIGIDYLQRTGWGASGEMRYLLAPRTQGVLTTYLLRNTGTDAQRWSVSTRNSHELPWGIHAEAEAFVQSDREFIGTQGTTIEERSSERTSSSCYLNRSWSAWDFSLSGRTEESLITEQRTTLTRFPELTIDRTSTRVFDTDLFLKISASGVRLLREDSETSFETTRLHFSPEVTWPLTLGTAARVIPTAGYALTRYSSDTEGDPETRSLAYYRIGLEGPRPYRVWDLGENGRYERLKHLIEPRVSYVHVPGVNQDKLPVFDSIDRIARADRIEYSLTNTLFARGRIAAAKAALPAVAGGWGAPPLLAAAGAQPAPEPAPLYDGGGPWLAEAPQAGAGPLPAEAAPAAPVQEIDPAALRKAPIHELFWLKLSQSYTFDSALATEEQRPFSPVEWEARTRPLERLELHWRGNVDVYGKGVGYQNVSLAWSPFATTSLRADWRTTRGASQDFLDLGATLSLKAVTLEGRSRYNIDEDTFVENRVEVKYVSQCWDVTLGYVKWTHEYQYNLLLSLKGIGTLVRI